MTSANESCSAHLSKKCKLNEHCLKRNAPSIKWECKLVQPLRKTVWKFLKKLKIEIPYDPVTSLLGIYQKKMKTLMQGSLGGAAGLVLPAAWGVILETRDRVPCWAPCMEPASPFACVSPSVCVCVSYE